MNIKINSNDSVVNTLASKRKTSFKGDVLRLATGTGIAQVIGFFVAPIITRIYAPEAFGVSAIFASMTGIISVMACMRYELSIVLPDNDREAANLLAVSISFSLIIAVLTILAILIAGPQILSFVKLDEFRPYLWFIPPMVFAHGAFLALNYWNTRTKHFARLSVARVTTVVTTNALVLGVGFAGYATGRTMIVAAVMGQTITASVLFAQIWRDDHRTFLNSISWSEMLNGVRKYKKFPLYNSFASFLNNASWQLPALLFGSFFSPTVVGYYALGFRVLKQPMSLVGTAIGQVFFQRSATSYHNGSLDLLVESSFRRLIKVGCYPALLLTVVGKDLFVIVFGAEWAEAGLYVQLLGPWGLVWFVSATLSSIFATVDRLGLNAYIQASIFLSRLVAIVIGGLLHSAPWALCLFTLTGIVVYGWMLISILKIAGSSVSKNLYYLLQQVLYLIPIMLLLVSLKIMGVSPFYIVLVSIVISAIYYIYTMRVHLNKRSL